MAKSRLDQLVVDRGLTESREQAQRLIRAGQVWIDGHRALKPGHTFAADTAIELTAAPRFVSRGGEKLEAAFDAFNLRVDGFACLDVGAATGGFTDCLLQHGAAKVYAVDVGKGLIHWRLRNDPRVVVLEHINARRLDASLFADPIMFATIDVSFISLTRILPAVTQVMVEAGHIVSLIKPQFEAGRKQVGKGGVVRDSAVRAEVVEKIKVFGTEALGLMWLATCESPLKGPAGNVEHLVLWRK